MEIFSLSGPSGTGKSTSALSFAYQKKIPAIIDDGLLIINGYRVAGTSAKFEKNTLTAVKRATFFDEIHIKEVQDALRIFFVNRILIIGTSDKMTKLISSRLQLGSINHFYHVEDIRSSSEIKLAQYIRKTEGKHIIPIPYKQVEQNFFKRLIQRGKEIFSSKKERIGETTIVLPDFHRGAIQIDKRVFRDIVRHICQLNPYVHKYDSIHIHLEGEPVIHFRVELNNPAYSNIRVIMEKLQQDLHNCFLQYLNIEFSNIHIQIANLTNYSPPYYEEILNSNQETIHI